VIRQPLALGFALSVLVLNHADAHAEDPSPSTTAGAASASSAIRSSQGSSPARVREVSVRGGSRAASARHSANAVAVVELEQAKQQASDLGEVLARNTAVSVQRAGGLGSRGAFSLGGLGGQRLRFFLDGVPLELMGYVAGVQNVPVNLLDRVEVYQGVVPVRLGADALGGAVQLLSDENVRTNRFSGSYQFGAFGTHRATASARVFHQPTGLLLKGSAFFDTADNDYEVDVSGYDAEGRTRAIRVPRFHDGYRGVGGQLGVGVVDKAWADRLILSGFISGFDNDVQNGATMARPYGAVTFERRTAGVNLKYSIARGSARFSMLAGYAALDTRFRDESNCIYDWYGHCTERSLRGEITGTAQAIDQATDTLFLRGELVQQLSEHHALRLALAPTYADRSGQNRLRVAGHDPLAQPRRLFTGVVGLELESSVWDDRLKNVAFAKGYGLISRSQQLLATGAWQDMSRDLFRLGGGDSLRFALTRELSAKLSYEYALRQPSTDELFGDGQLVLENLALRPEVSHNANLGLRLEDYPTDLGSLRASLEGFARWSDQMIALLAESDYLRNVNVWQARALGVDTSLGWTVPHSDWLSLDGRLTYQDVRNRSGQSEYAKHVGERIPSIPYLFASGQAVLRAHGLLAAQDSIELSWNTHYVHSFYRGWKTGAQNRSVVPAQVSHGVVLTYTFVTDGVALHATLEAQNITNAELFDFYRVQRPGRALYTKWTLDW